ncbi:MORN repeat-containing protein [Thiospirochaeta perfilievii]|nr:hypothetical protein [Thiospirochaeta perfilievii]
MDDLIHFSGKTQKITVEASQIQKGTFHDKEGKKNFILEAEFNRNGELLVKKYPDQIEHYIFHNEQMICKHVAKLDKTPIYKVDYYYQEDLLVKKVRVNNDGIVEDSESFYYNTEGLLEKKQSRTMLYEYVYNNNNLLIEERWHSDLNLNQIIRYKYEEDLLIETLYLSGDEIPGRKIELKRNKSGFITEEIIYSASNLIVSHFKFEYITNYKNNWLKRVKYTLHTQNKRKEAAEVQYRDFKFFEELEAKKDEEITIESGQDIQELEFDNGIYKGEVVNGEMHGFGDFIFNTGTRYQGSFKNNVMEGKGKLTYINGKVYEGTFANNMLEGPGACKWANGDFYAGEFKNGKMHGRGCYIWSNGNRFEGIFEENRRTEQGILYKRSELESDAPPEWVNELFK